MTVDTSDWEDLKPPYELPLRGLSNLRKITDPDNAHIKRAVDNILKDEENGTVVVAAFQSSI